MRQLVSRLWKDDGGALLAVEWVFVATILVIGSITGLVCVRNAIIEELEDFAEAIESLCTSWHFRDCDDGDDEGDHGHKGHHNHHDNGHHNGWRNHHGDDFNRNLGSLHHGGDD
jgi:Flp pilus assembly pilin Flp